MSDHTPGPWTVRDCGPHWNNPSLPRLEVNYGNDGECICDTVYRAADANLIAAAPDLLKALRGMTEDAYHGVSAESWRRKAVAAIAKAEGRS